MNQSPLKKYALWVGIGLALLLIMLAYWHYQRDYPSTNDAYIDANVVNVASQVTGPIQQVYVSNYHTLKKGQWIAQIDPRPFQIAVNKAQAKLALATQKVKAEAAAVQAAQAVLAETKAKLEVAQKNVPRTLTLAQSGKIAQAQGVAAAGKLHSAQAAYLAAQNQLKEAQQEVGQRGQANATILAAKAALAQAKLNLQHTQIIAPANGTLINFTLRPGDMVIARKPLFSLIENKQWWVKANFKETALDRIHPGEKVRVHIDMYPDHTFHGRVAALSRGSGAAFSLLPPENATGNWVKVTQRFPVKIIITDPSPKFPLRIGASSHVRVNTVD